MVAHCLSSGARCRLFEHYPSRLTSLSDLDRHYLHMSAATKKKLESEVDEFGDFYFIDVDDSDLLQVGRGSIACPFLMLLMIMTVLDG